MNALPYPRLPRKTIDAVDSILNKFTSTDCIMLQKLWVNDNPGRNHSAPYSDEQMQYKELEFVNSIERFTELKKGEDTKMINRWGIAQLLVWNRCGNCLKGRPHSRFLTFKELEALETQFLVENELDLIGFEIEPPRMISERVRWYNNSKK